MITEIVAFPNKKYKIIYADPPWMYKDKGCGGGCKKYYDIMSIDNLKELPINSISYDDCTLFLWTTYPMFKNALELIESWGFIYKTIAFQWIKTTKKGKYFYGLGRWTRGNTEPCLLAIKGNPKRINKGISQLVFSRNREHSRKPTEVRNKIVKLMGDISRVELFAREKVEGWDCWGNEDDMYTLHTQKIKNYF